MLAKLSKYQRLIRVPQASFSIKNYMKTFQPDQVTRYHGHFRVDEFNHFDKDNEAVNKFIAEEKKLYKKQSQKWKHITDEYYEISSSRRDTRLQSVPERYDQYEYYTKTTWKDTKEYVTVHRRSSDGSDELVLDIMDYPYIRKHYQTVELLGTAFSPSHQLVAFGIDLKNNEKSAYLIAKTTGKRQLLKVGESPRSPRLENAHDLVFASETEIYFLKSENHRPCKLCWMNIETGESEEVFQQQNEQFYLGLKLSKDKKFLLLSGISKTQSKIYYLNKEKQKKLTKIWEGKGKVYINHIQNNFVIWAVKDQSEIRLIQDQQVNTLLKGKRQIDLSKIKGDVLYRSEEEEIIEDIDLLKDNIILYGYKVTKPLIKIINYLKKGKQFEIKQKVVELPFSYGTIAPCTNEDYNADSIQFSFSTPFVYEEIYSYSLSKQKCSVVQKYQHTGPAFHHTQYHIQTVQVPATDMSTIPLTIIGPKKRRMQKMLFNFYGCYGLPSRIPYDNVSIAALQKGWTICHAHVRGGNQKGKKWHSQAQGDHRVRTWMDVEECVGYLLRQQYTNPALLFLMSSSAGAINLWNIISRKPHLYKGAIFRNPFLDVLSSLMDPEQPLSNTDYQQFGNPISNARIYQQISAISPYENIAPKEYPSIHISAGENDYRTPVNQIAKFVNRYRSRAMDSSRVEHVGIKNVSVDISETGSHLGEASIKDENYRACNIFGYMDYVVDYQSRDCSRQK